MPDDTELTQQYIEKRASLDALRQFEKDLLSVEQIAVQKRAMYRAAIPTVLLNERIQNCDWWARFVTIGACTVAGIAIGIVAGPAAIAWLTASSAAAWGGTVAGLSAGTVAWLTVTGARLAVPSVVAAAFNEVTTDKPQTLLGALYEARWQAQYREQVKKIEFKMLGFTDFSFFPAILYSPYDFVFDIENLYRHQAAATGLRADKIEDYKTRFCLHFWSELCNKIYWDKMPKGRYGFKGYGTRFTFEVSDLEAEVGLLEARIREASGRAR